MSDLFRAQYLPGIWAQRFNTLTTTMQSYLPTCETI